MEVNLELKLSLCRPWGHTGSCFITPLILNLCTTWDEWQLHASVVLTPGRRPRQTLNKRVCRPRSRSWRLGEERHSLPKSVIEPRFLEHPIRRLFTVYTSPLFPKWSSAERFLRNENKGSWRNLNITPSISQTRASNLNRDSSIQFTSSQPIYARFTLILSSNTHLDSLCDLFSSGYCNQDFINIFFPLFLVFFSFSPC